MRYETVHTARNVPFEQGAPARFAPVAAETETAIVSVSRDVLERVQNEIYRTSRADPEQLVREQAERITALVPRKR